jgi:hypothetical protein
MYQKEIEFFWPLTEQIPLELDYTQPDKPKDSYPLYTTGISMCAYPTTWTTSINIDTNNITITSKITPPLYRRILYKLLGINWKQS